MGTKTNPGKFDCYSKAEPDEPLFVLLARDSLAPILVRLWADIQVNSRSSTADQAKTDEAKTVAAAMETWRCRQWLAKSS